MTAATTQETAPTKPGPDGYLVRDAETRDLGAVRAISCAVFGESNAYPEFLFAQLTDILGEGFAVAEHHGDVVGYSVTMLDAGDKTRGDILAVAAQPAAQSSGAEDRLREAATEYLIRRSRELREAVPGADDLEYVRPATAEDPYAVRRFRTADLDELYEVELSAFGDDPYPRVLFQQLAGVLGGGFFVAEAQTSAGTRVVGYLLAVLDARYPDLGWVMSVAVHADHRGRGVGNHLMEAAEEYLRSQRCGEVVLTVDPDNTPAVTLYKTRDYREIERHDDHHGLNLSRLVMKQHTFVDVPRLNH